MGRYFIFNLKQKSPDPVKSGDNFTFNVKIRKYKYMENLEIPELFKKSVIARALWPDNTDAPSYLDKKLKNRNGQSLNGNDKQRIYDYIKKESENFIKIILK